MQNYFNEKEKYYINSQKYSECQLVSAINAAIYLNEIPVIQNSIEYERLVDLICARIGAAISIELAHQYLRIKSTDLDTIDLNILRNFLDNKNPIEVKIAKPFYHSALIIDYKKEGNYLIQVLNYTQTDSEGWIEWKLFNKFLPKETLFIARAFELDPWYLRDLQIKNNQRILSKL
jgi:hypothetical protein